MTTDQQVPTTPRTHPVHAFAGAALTTLDRVVSTPAWSMSTAEQAETLAELTALEARVTELRLRVLAAAHRDGIGDASGATSTAAWLAQQTRTTRVRAHADLRLALALDDPALAPTREALARGRLQADQARVVVRTLEDLATDEVTPAERETAQRHLLDLASVLDAKQLQAAGRRIFEVIAPEEADRREGEALEREERRARARCRFALRDNGDGTTSGWFRIPTLQGQMLSKVVQAFAAPRRRAGSPGEDGRSVPYAAALGQGFAELVEHLPTDKLPRAGGVAATIVVTMDLQALRDGLAAAGLDTGGRISAAEVRRLACTAGLVPAVLGTRSQPLDLGRRVRLHTPAQRAAMALRDQGCTAHGCDRPTAWCEAHHEVPWSRGGPTTVEGGRLLCPRHHHLAHDSRYDMRRLPDGKVRFHART
ncbi:MAG: DUF222 domain-containing protein [Nocardioidaceae bacterium]